MPIDCCPRGGALIDCVMQADKTVMVEVVLVTDIGSPIYSEGQLNAFESVVRDSVAAGFVG